MKNFPRTVGIAILSICLVGILSRGQSSVCGSQGMDIHNVFSSEVTACQCGETVYPIDDPTNPCSAQQGVLKDYLAKNRPTLAELPADVTRPSQIEVEEQKSLVTALDVASEKQACPDDLADIESIKKIFVRKMTSAAKNTLSLKQAVGKNFRLCGYNSSYKRWYSEKLLFLSQNRLESRSSETKLFQSIPGQTDQFRLVSSSFGRKPITSGGNSGDLRFVQISEKHFIAGVLDPVHNRYFGYFVVIQQ